MGTWPAIQTPDDVAPAWDALPELVADAQAMRAELQSTQPQPERRKPHRDASWDTYFKPSGLGLMGDLVGAALNGWTQWETRLSTLVAQRDAQPILTVETPPDGLLGLSQAFWGQVQGLAQLRAAYRARQKGSRDALRTLADHHHQVVFPALAQQWANVGTDWLGAVNGHQQWMTQHPITPRTPDTPARIAIRLRD